MGYAMALIISGRELHIPVLPEKLEVSSPGRNEKATVLELGEVLRLQSKGLRSITWSGFFPSTGAPYVTGEITTPGEAVRAIQKARDKARPIRFLLTGGDLDCNMRVGIESFDYEERGGEVGDIYYDLKLTEWRDYSPKRIILPEQPGQPAQEQNPDREGEPPAQKTHTVVKGDCLWNIAQKHYGDGNRYPEIYRANQAQIDARNKGTGLPKYTIYAGQVFTLP